jgi:hypothetical protein
MFYNLIHTQVNYRIALVVVVAADLFVHRVEIDFVNLHFAALVAQTDLEMLWLVDSDQGRLDNYKDLPEQDVHIRYSQKMFSLFFQDHMKNCKNSTQTRLKRVSFIICITCKCKRVKKLFLLKLRLVLDQFHDSSNVNVFNFNYNNVLKVNA